MSVMPYIMSVIPYYVIGYVTGFLVMASIIFNPFNNKLLSPGIPYISVKIICVALLSKGFMGKIIIVRDNQLLCFADYGHAKA